MNSYQYERMLIAKKRGKYGHLGSWEELYYFQRTCATPQQLQEIASYARRNTKEKIRLPLSIQRQLDIKQESLIDK